MCGKGLIASQLATLSNIENIQKFVQLFMHVRTVHSITCVNIIGTNTHAERYTYLTDKQNKLMN